MKILLTTANTYKHVDAPAWLIEKSTMQSIICTEDPEEADVILFVEAHHVDDPYFRNVINHAFYKKFKKKCVLYHDTDLSITALPTISPSIEKWQYNLKTKRTSHYIARMCENETINNAQVNYPPNRDFLYSFSGAKTHGLRTKILSLNHPTNSFVKDTSGFRAWELIDAERRIYEEEYLDVMNRSYFILTPRGIGPATYRLFESMQLGRVPIIIADQWVKIPNIEWDTFSITIPESKIAQIPHILRERKDDAVEMGKIARTTWENFFSPEVSLYRICLVAQELQKNQYNLSDAFKDYSQFFRSSWHFKNFLRYKKNQMKKHFKPAITS